MRESGALEMTPVSEAMPREWPQTADFPHLTLESTASLCFISKKQGKWAVFWNTDATGKVLYCLDLPQRHEECLNSSSSTGWQLRSSRPWENKPYSCLNDSHHLIKPGFLSLWCCNSFGIGSSRKSASLIHCIVSGIRWPFFILPVISIHWLWATDYDFIGVLFYSFAILCRCFYIVVTCLGFYCYWFYVVVNCLAKLLSEWQSEIKKYSK